VVFEQVLNVHTTPQQNQFKSNTPTVAMSSISPGWKRPQSKQKDTTDSVFGLRLAESNDSLEATR